MMGLTYKKNMADMRESYMSGLLGGSRSCLWLQGDGVERGQVVTYHVKLKGSNRGF